MVNTCSILASSHVSVPYKTNQRKFGLQRRRQEWPKWLKPAKWVILKRDGRLDALFKGYGRDSSCSGLLTCQGTLWNQSEAIRTFQDPSGTSKRTQNSQIGDFQRRRQIPIHFLKVMAENQVVLDFSHVRVPYGTI